MHSLLEMVLAIAIAGFIFAGAIIPTTQTIAAYQEGEAELSRATQQELARVRPEQILDGVWRDLTPPTGGGALTQAHAAELIVGTWELRASGGQLEQCVNGGSWSPLAVPIQNFALSYLRKDGAWVNAVGSAELDEVVAVRFSWEDAAVGRTYGDCVALPDRCFSGGVIELSSPDTSQPYQRADYTRLFSISLGEWQ